MESGLSPLAELAALEAPDSFVARHIAPNEAEIAAMLECVGAPDLAALTDRAIPASIRLSRPPDLPPPLDEFATIAELRKLAGWNDRRKPVIGQGYYGTHIPPVIQRNVLENPGWYTAYTPYQAEIAQGRLEALLIFQTMVCELTGMEIANASLLDEATAAAEAMTMAYGLAGKATQSDTLAVAADLHPQTRAVLAVRARPLGLRLVDIPPGDADAIRAARPFALLLQAPGTDGQLRDLREEIAAVQKAGGLAAVAADLLALTLLTPPGEMGADIVIGSAQRFGVPMGFGGPHAAFFATRDKFKRAMPGRLVGVSRDAAGNPALRLALQTREQHIRRDKATSNICTAQVLLAVMSAFYAVWHGPEGLRRIARRVNLQARLLAGVVKLRGLHCGIHNGRTIRHEHFFDTIVIETPDADEMVKWSALNGFHIRRLDARGVAVALDETVTHKDLENLTLLLGGSQSGGFLTDDISPYAPPPSALLRTTPFLQQPVFQAHHSEHEMLRFLKRLEDKDVALNRGMMPLGSCTMKLNAAAEMMAVTLPGFADIHPFMPAHYTEGYAELIERLQTWLQALTGFAAISLQPNAGSQGEYAGLLAIRAWHESRGEARRDVCLIPTSAHGTNPASAVMAGLRVVMVACDRNGGIDFDDLTAKADAHCDALAALMATYPSTHGVFEDRIADICALIHARGGQVYLDGANMNAQLGLTSPASIGADVCHLNLHKTFCIPHGGGGPGVGPIGVAAHLAPFLPNHPARPDAGPATGPGPVAAAPFGSASILPVSYAYIRMMGAAGLKRASQVAILNANYIVARLRAHYPMLFAGKAAGLVAHECILDCRPFQAEAGVTVEDIAKRLQDFGYHAPTMSWPVAGTLMVEPTESESQAELDRFCDAMIAIRQEIAAIAAGALDRQDNPLKNAPHTAAELLVGEWRHSYTREQAAYPLPWVRAAKYWPPVSRVDNVFGDRNMACCCPGVEG